MKEERKNLPSRFAVFSAKNGEPEVVARFEDDDVWLTQEHLAIIFNTTKQLISQHIGNISNRISIKQCKGILDWKERSESTNKSLYLRLDGSAVRLLYRADHGQAAPEGGSRCRPRAHALRRARQRRAARRDEGYGLRQAIGHMMMPSSRV